MECSNLRNSQNLDPTADHTIEHRENIRVCSNCNCIGRPVDRRSNNKYEEYGTRYCTCSRVEPVRILVSAVSSTVVPTVLLRTLERERERQ